jgi:Rha family phage regulatory protein
MSTLTMARKQFSIDSREVAEMTGKEHRHVLRDIREYIEILDSNPSPNLDSANFFIESSYFDSQNQERPCYLITRKGCDLVANKMTGEKGVLFTATYVTKFEEMEQKKQLDTTQLSPELQIVGQLFQALAKSELEAKETRQIAIQANQTVQVIKETIMHQPDNWREEINRMITKISHAVGENKFREVRVESYKMLEQRAGVNLERRLVFMKVRLLESGKTKSDSSKANKMDVISDDKKLREIYSSIVKEYMIKYCT